MSQFFIEHGHSLVELGWNNRFQQQLSLEEWEVYQPARVVQQHKSEINVFAESGALTIKTSGANHLPLTVGDWLLLDSKHSIYRVLERSSIFSRKAAGSKVAEQLIAANVDTLFIVSSLNNDFNLNRIERYLVLAHEAGVEPLVVLTKADLCESRDVVDDYIAQIKKLDKFLTVVALNALDSSAKQQLSPWCKVGKTLALLGSSGVGKSTLVNSLLGENTQNTDGIREDDSKGHHTTTSRSLHIISSNALVDGGIVLDTPGMRELQMANSEEGIAETFADVIQLSKSCKFSNCQHESEPGCAVQAAIESNELSSRRLQSFQKLQKEDAFNSASLAERRDKNKKREKFYRSVISHSRHLKNR